MDNALFDKESWKRSFAPAFRVFAYTTIIYTLLFLIIMLPYFLLSLIGLDISALVTPLMAIGFVMGIFVAFFKVLDEMRPGDIPLQMA